jgi:hypothetical protein
MGIGLECIKAVARQENRGGETAGDQSASAMEKDV